MEQLQRLAEVIAETYIRDLRRETGSNIISIGGVSGNVEITCSPRGLSITQYMPLKINMARHLNEKPIAC